MTGTNGHAGNGHAGNGHDPSAGFFYRNPFTGNGEDPNPGANNPGFSPGMKDDEQESIICEALTPIPISSLAPRPWAYGHFLLFGCASVLAAVDGGGKGAYAVTVALSMITGIPLLGEKVWRTGPVVILTYEDDQLEWHRRIAAACLEFDLDYAEICGSIYFISRPRGRIALAAHAAVGNRNVIFPDHAEIVAHLKRIRPVLFIIDPLNHAHALDDGNSNVLIAQLAAEVSSIAAETMVALLALHHLRKGATGSLDDMMGAVALRATFRATRILAAMTDTDAKNVGLDEDEEIWRYRRIASSKENYAPPADKTLWFQLESRDLGNVDVDPTYPGGDNVQVFKPFKIPEAHNGFTKSMAADILDQLRKGPEQGEFYLPHQNAKESWAGWPICEIAEKSAREAGRILADWIKNGIVIENDYPSPKRSRHLTARIIVNEPKAAAMLGALYRPPA